jgi:hypothetical protein
MKTKKYHMTRVWHKQKKTMYYCDFVSEEDNNVRIMMAFNSYTTTFNSSEVVILPASTKLDRNNTVIFAGDAIFIRKQQLFYEVKYENNNFIVKALPAPNLKNTTILNLYDLEECLVVGDIYTKPSLVNYNVQLGKYRS